MSAMMDSVGSVGFRSILLLAVGVILAMVLLWWMMAPNADPTPIPVALPPDAGKAPINSELSVPEQPTEEATQPRVVIDSEAGRSERSVPAERKPPAQVPVGKAASPQGSYSIQTGAFKTTEAAQRLFDRLCEKGYETFVEQPSASNGSVYRIYVGSFSTASQAEPTRVQLGQEGMESFIRKLR